MAPLARLLSTLALTVVLAAACSGDNEPTLLESPTPPATASPPDALGDIPPTPTPAPPPANAIKVGVLLDVGNLDIEDRDPGNVMSPLDRQPGVAFTAAIGSINDAGGLLGRPVSIIATDTTSRLSVIDAAAEDMLADGVELLVVTCELDFAQPAIQRAEAVGVLVISPCASEAGWASGEAGPLAFSMVAEAETYGVAMADYAWGQGYRSVAILSDATAPEARAECGAFTDRWTELGGTPTYAEAFSLRGSETLDENLTISAAFETDVLILCAFPTIGLKLLAGLRTLGATLPIVASPSLDSGTWLPIDIASATDGAGDLGDFVMFTLASVWGDDPSPKMQSAIDGFFASQAITPSSGRFVVGADLADVWAQAVTRAGTTDGAAVAREIRAMRSIESASGVLSFAGSQAPNSRDLRVMRHSNGTFVFDQLVSARR